MKKNQNILEIILFSIFSIVGVFFLIAGIIWYQVASNKEKTFIKTEATITYIGKSSTYGSEQKRMVEVEFQVDGKKYEAELSEWNHGMKVGNVLEILYNPENPNEIMGNGYSFGYWIFIGMGTLFVVIGLIPCTIVIFKKQKRKRLLKIGTKVEATIDNIGFKMNYSVNGKHPYILECSFVDSKGMVYFFKSDSIWYPIEVLLEHQNIKTVPVYVDMKNPKKYYVEVEYFNQYIGN